MQKKSRKVAEQNMLWIIIGVVGTIILIGCATDGFEYSCDDVIIVFGLALTLMITSVGFSLTNSFNIIPQKVSKTTQTYELKEYWDNAYYVSNTSGNSITILIKDAENTSHEETFTRSKVTFGESDTPKVTVKYRAKKKHNLRDKIWFFVKDGKNDGKKIVEKAVIYLPNESATNKVFCVSCGAENSSDAEYCSKCGAKLVKAKTCTECGNKLTEGDVFCSKCGKKVE